MEHYFSALILMGGEGRRMGSSLPKQFHKLGSLKVYQHTLKTFQTSKLFQEIILVCHPDWIDVVREETPLPVRIIPGGASRQASSWEGLKACNPSCHYVMIHDAVRPFVSLQILQENARAVLKYGAIDTVIESADTLVVTEDGKTLQSIPPRHQLRRGQTPQTFAYPLISEAHAKASPQASLGATDDCRLVIDLGATIHLVEGSEDNMKITTERDLLIAQRLIQQPMHLTDQVKWN
jgi:2-C-methyl-D-erythritol 4-phosphate cytidylyltransferase